MILFTAVADQAEQMERLAAEVMPQVGPAAEPCTVLCTGSASSTKRTTSFVLGRRKKEVMACRKLRTPTT